MPNLIGEIFGWFGASLAIIFYFAPICQFKELIKGQIDYKKIPFLLLLMSLLTIIFWLIYGFLLNRYQLIITNVIGGIATAIFIVIYLIYFTKKKITESLILIFSFIIINIFLIVIVANFIKVKIIGKLAMIFNILMFASPCFKIVQVCQTKDYKFLPINSSIAGCASSSCWAIYGIGSKDFNLIVPNGLGLCFSVTQVIVFIIYFKKAKILNKIVDENLIENTDNSYDSLGNI